MKTNIIMISTMIKVPQWLDSILSMAISTHQSLQNEFWNSVTNSDRPKGKRPGRDSEEESETFSDFTMRSDTARAAEMDYYGRGDERYNSYQEQDGRRGYRPASSQVSYGGNRSSGASTPNYGIDYNALPMGQRSKEPYPAWT